MPITHSKLYHVLDTWVTQKLYSYISKKDTEGVITFMNYGYDDNSPIELSAEDEKDRYTIQLYHLVANQVGLQGKDVLEVGSGRGGGASYVKRYLKPRSLTGLDLCDGAVDFCTSFHGENGLTFVQGNAQKMPFKDNSFDVVLNVESSHRYLDVPKFYSEVRRVLKPGGHFLYTDFFLRKRLPLTRSLLEEKGFAIKNEKTINEPVLRAVDSLMESRREIIRNHTSKIFWSVLNEFACSKHSRKYRNLSDETLHYLNFHLIGKEE